MFEIKYKQYEKENVYTDIKDKEKYRNRAICMDCSHIKTILFNMKIDYCIIIE
jgi:hypothetical protein